MTSITQTTRHSITAALVRDIYWTDGDTGFCQCPGQHRHTHSNKRRDCRVTLDKVPTLYCVHTSCLSEVERVNHELRSAIAKAECGKSPIIHARPPTAEELARKRERAANERLKLRAEASLPQILKDHATDPVDYFELSPMRLLDDPSNDWRMLLGLFQPDDIVWIGQVYDSGKQDHTRNFRSVREWFKEPAAFGQFTSPSIFKRGSFSRSNENVVQRRFLVIESDHLNKAEMCAIITWCRQFMRLRAIVDTAGKSLHGWFDWPGKDAEKQLKAILPKLKCDPALFRNSQPCRLPGAIRGKNYQALLYLDPNP